MRNWLLGGAIAVLCFAAQFGVAQATVLPYQATLQLTLGTLPTMQTTASGTAHVAADGSFTIPASVFAMHATLTPPLTTHQSFKKIVFAFHNDVGMFGQTATAGGPMPLRGNVQFFPILGAGYPDFSLPLTPPYSGSYTSATASVMSVPRTFQLSGATNSWMTGKVTVTSVDPVGNTATRVTTGSDQRTTMQQGTLNLVIPVVFREYRDLALYDQLPLVAHLTFSFAPEPTSGATAAAAFGVLALLGRNALRRRHATRRVSDR